MEYTPEEVAKHCTVESLWLIIKDNVYDVTAFRKLHPGGEAPLEDSRVAGQDVTKMFLMLHDESVLTKSAAKFKIGTVKRRPSTKQTPVAGLGPMPVTLKPSSTPSAQSGGTSHLLPAERARASFDTKKMTEALYGGAELVAKRTFILHPTKAINNGYKKYDMTREEAMETHIKDFVSIHKPFTLEGYRPTSSEVSWMSEGATNTGSFMPHYGLFVPTILGQASDTQMMAWLPRALTFQLVGSYAQTELAHGSNVRGLQTTATFDKTQDCFILDTPTLGATKWWNSNAGIVATHAAVFAQLIVNGKEHGVHVFFVQLRDENHAFLPGILAGDVGAKMGDNTIDTSWIRFNKVKIPRQHLFSKRQHVTRDGQYVKHVKEGSGGGGGGHAHYLTMMMARAGMIQISAGKLSIAATTAARYSCVRQQGFVDSSASASFKSAENAVIEYQVQRYRVLKQIATAYAMRFNGRAIADMMTKLQAEAVNPKATLDELPEVHATTAGLKGLCTKLAGDGIEDCRRLCGGHGYLLNSGVALLSIDYAWQITAEGEAHVLLLQTARFLLKQRESARRGEKLTGLTECFAPLRDAGFNPIKDARPKIAQTTAATRDLHHILGLFQYRVLVAIDRVGAQFDAIMKRPGVSFEDAFNSCSLSLLLTAQSHCLYFMLKQMVDQVSKEHDGKVKMALERLAAVFGLTEIMDGKQWSGLLTAQEVDLTERAVRELLDECRGDVVAYVDAFDWPDAVLNSTIGRYDGNVYEALFEAAFHSPLNTGKPFKGYDDLHKSLDLDFLRLRQKVTAELVDEGEGEENVGAKL